MIRTLIRSSVVLFLLFAAASPLWAADGVKGVIDLAAPGAEKLFSTTSAQIEVTPGTDVDPGINIVIQPGPEEYPGIDFKPAKPWDLSAFGHLEVRIKNTGSKAISPSVRIDNAGEWKDGPWNTEQTTIKPGATGTVNLIFGFAYGHKPGYKLNSAAISNLKIFCGKSKDVTSFRIVAVEAAGVAGEKPPVDPETIRTVPTDGVILGAGIVIDPAKQMTLKNAKATVVESGVKLVFASGKSELAASFKPLKGRWDLRSDLQVRVKLKNDGQAPIKPHVRIDSNAGPTDSIAAAEPIAPGAEVELVVPFASAVTWQGIKNSGDRTSWNGQPGTGTRFVSDAVSAVTVTVDQAASEQSLVVESIVADVPPPAELPDWLGTRPPVEGEWTKTFDDEFDGTAVDLTKWNNTGQNYWDQKTHWSKDNVIIADGFAKLHYEKKTGNQNDDPKGKQTAYACGFLDTYGKWVQKYGYFETRLKLPTAPGLWPAFWLMPDRGVAAGPQWKRQDTANGAMEFDVMEYLSRWGPHRYNISMHWDGYEKAHKQTGSEKNYFQADKDGFITVGLLWTPGSAIYYCNGKEILRWEDPRISQVDSNMMFTMPMGGWDNNAIDDSKLPDDLVIDYVRCWQRKDLKSLPATNPTAGADVK